MALEYWCNFDDPIWRKEDLELIEQAKKEILMTGLVKDRNVIVKGAVIKIARSYPVYNKGYKENLGIITQFLNSFKNITAIGRYGSFKYNNQDHSILMGIIAADDILNNARHDLWRINTDYETYQESSTIDETGLVQNSHR